ELLQQETSAEVRLRLYQALASQENYDAEKVLALTQKESDQGARLAGLDLLAEVCRSAPIDAVLEFFKQTAVAELKRTALTAESLPDRLASVTALRHARTAEANDALQEIAGAAGERKVVEAARAALQTVPRN